MDLTNIAYGGEFAAITAALLWAVASALFERAGKKIGSVELNLIKGILALIFLGFTMLFTGETFANLDTRSLLLLAASGVIGIGLGDTAFFKALDHMGPRRSLLVSALTPAVSALIAMLFLHETLSSQAWLGMFITIAGIAWVITERSGTSGGFHFPIQGVVYALIFTLSQAISSVLSRAVLSQSGISSLQSTLIRLSAGVLVLAGWVVITGIPLGRWLKDGQAGKAAMQTASATFVGTYLGMWLQQTAIKLLPVGIAQTLSSTSPLFILPIAALSHDRIGLRAVMGAALAVLGIILLFLA